jgi:hypothetical protein
MKIVLRKGTLNLDKLKAAKLNTDNEKRIFPTKMVKVCWKYVPNGREFHASAKFCQTIRDGRKRGGNVFNSTFGFIPLNKVCRIG